MGGGGQQRRWRVLLVGIGYTPADGYFEFVGGELPVVGSIIDVRDSRDHGHVIRARVEHVAEQADPPIAAVEVFAG